MKIDVSEIERKYRGMTHEEFDRLKRGDLTGVAQEVYDRERAIRNTPDWISLNPKPEAPTPPTIKLSKGVKKQLAERAKMAWNERVKRFLV